MYAPLRYFTRSVHGSFFTGGATTDHRAFSARIGRGRCGPDHGLLARGGATHLAALSRGRTGGPASARRRSHAPAQRAAEEAGAERADRAEARRLLPRACRRASAAGWRAGVPSDDRPLAR